MRNRKWTHKINTQNIKNLIENNGLLGHLMPMCSGLSYSLALLTGGGKMTSIFKNGEPIDPKI